MNHLNERSLQMINTIYNNFSSHPTFSKYQIETVYDFRNGIVNLDISLNGNLRNKFMFCPDLNGNIGSVAIYGAELEGHLRSIKSSMKFCGLNVKEVSIDREGYSPYVDVILEKY